MHNHDERIGLGIALRVGAMACSAGLAALVKWCSEHGIPVMEIVLFRSLFGFVPAVVQIQRTAGFSMLKTSRPVGHIVRSCIGATGMICLFGSASRLPLVEATALTFTSPLFMTALSVPILGEKVGPHRWAAVAVGFVGMLIMVHPDPTHMVATGMIFGVVGALATACAMITIRQIAGTEPGPRIVFYFTLACTLVGLVGVLLFGWVTPSPLVLVMLVMSGLVGGLGQMLMTEAMRRAPVAVVAPFDYTQLVWSSLIGFLVWNQTPRALTLIGSAVVAASGLYILYREMKVMRLARA